MGRLVHRPSDECCLHNFKKTLAKTSSIDVSNNRAGTFYRYCQSCCLSLILRLKRRTTVTSVISRAGLTATTAKHLHHRDVTRLPILSLTCLPSAESAVIANHSTQVAMRKRGFNHHKTNQFLFRYSPGLFLLLFIVQVEAFQ